VSDATVDRVQVFFQRSPQKSTRRASRELQLPHTTVSKILRKRSLMKPYKLQSVQALKSEDLAVRYEFCREILARNENDDLPARLISSDETTFHINGKVNWHNIRAWETENPHVTLEHERDLPKVNVFCAISKEKVYGPFVFVETPSRVSLTQTFLPYGFCPSWKRILSTLSSNKMGRRTTSTWLFGTT
jgi:hypothetical protein